MLGVALTTVYITVTATEADGVPTAGAPYPEAPMFVPSAVQETNAWEAIQRWQYVAEERRNRRPNIDIYSSANDECISTSSLLTYSVTEAPSTGGQSHSR
jgi:hypothetical protein